MVNCLNCGSTLKNYKCKHCKSDFTPIVRKQDIKLNIVIDGDSTAGIKKSRSQWIDGLGIIISFIGLVFTILTIVYAVL